MRYERKYCFYQISFYRFLSIIKEFNFTQSFPDRKVSSIYYDSDDFYFYNQAVSGNSDKVKKRVRWYNNEKNLLLETKIKKSELGYKKYKKIEDFNDNLKPFYFWNKNFQKKNKQYIPDSLDIKYFPKLLVTYRRFYFVSNCSDIRITLDLELIFYKIINLGFQFISPYYLTTDECVLEIKYENKKINEFLIQNLLDSLDINIIKFSKYAKAVSMLY